MNKQNILDQIYMLKLGDFKLIERLLEKPEISIFINKGK